MNFIWQKTPVSTNCVFHANTYWNTLQTKGAVLKASLTWGLGQQNPLHKGVKISPLQIQNIHLLTVWKDSDRFSSHPALHKGQRKFDSIIILLQLSSKPHQMWKEPQIHSICTSETFITEWWVFPHLITLPLAFAVWQCSEEAVFPGPLNHKFTHSSPKLHAVPKLIIKKDHSLQYTNHAATDFFHSKDKDWG